MDSASWQKVVYTAIISLIITRWPAAATVKKTGREEGRERLTGAQLEDEDDSHWQGQQANQQSHMPQYHLSVWQLTLQYVCASSVLRVGVCVVVTHLGGQLFSN